MIDQALVRQNTVFGDGDVTGNLAVLNLAITGTAGAGYIDLTEQSAEPVAPAAGTVRIHGETADARTFPEFANESGVMVVMGRDSVFIVKNVSGGAITKGQAVYVFGSSGNSPTVKLAKSDATATILGTIGIVAEASIANNGFGHVMVGGVIEGINTATFAAGDGLFVSAVAAGTLTNVAPAYPNFQKKVGTVLNVGTGNGSMLINTAPFTGGTEIGTNAASYTFGGKIGVGGVTAPTAVAHIKAGTAAAGTAPLKFTLASAVLNTTAEAGAIEADAAGNVYATNSSAVRSKLLASAVTIKTGAYTVTVSDFAVLVDLTTGSFSITLPAAPEAGQLVNIKKVSSDANTMTIARNGLKIEGASADITTAATNFPSYTLQYDGVSSWWIL